MFKSDCLILLGPPNSGKTTLFNWITGCKRQIVNYPGSTAELASGQVNVTSLSPSSPPWTVIDTPGFYGFFSSTPEAEVTKKVLKASLENKKLRAVILVLDSTRLKRQLPLFFQLQSTGLPIILALTMYDIQKKESELNMSLLSHLLNQTGSEKGATSEDFSADNQNMKQGDSNKINLNQAQKHKNSNKSSRKVPVCPIEGLLGGGVKELVNQAHAHFRTSVSLAQPFSLTTWSKHHWSENKQAVYLKKAHKIVDQVLIKKEKPIIGQKTKILDSFLLHPVFGFVFLSLILFGFFSSIFWLAQPLMDLVDKGVDWGVNFLLNVGGPFVLMDFLANGVWTGFGSFLIFIPQIFILFLGLYLLEDSGYMARAVSLLDGPFSRIGLSGKSLFPFLSGFACAIPAILSARAISSKRERWITIFVLPFMTCSARLPVYALLLGFLFYGDSAWKPGLWMSFLYFLSLFLGVAGAGLLSVFVPKDKKSSFFMELPLYRRPVLKSVLSVSWSRTKHFIFKAGPVIFVFSLLMWIATNYPQPSGQVLSSEQALSSGQALPSEQALPSGQVLSTGQNLSLPSRGQNLSQDGSQVLSTHIEHSYAGQFGQWIEPVFEKMGGDWRVGVSLLSAFVAREVFVSVLAVTLKNTKESPFYHINQTGSGQEFANQNSPDEEKTGLVKVMKQAQRGDGSPLFSQASILALLIFFVFSLQCLSTTAVVYKETGSWTWAGAQLIGFNLLAYFMAMLTYNLL